MSKRLWLGFGMLGVTLIAMFCSSSGQRHSRSPQPPSGTAAGSTSSPQPPSAIRSVDFENISYPNFPDYSDPNGREKKFITLRPGEGGPNFINYGDVTGDGVEDAIVALGIENHGSAIPDYVYIFVMENGKPRLIWDFETGDRADGGLRNVYAENGKLVIELFGKDRVIGGQLYKGDEALCCPSSITKTGYKWTGKTFEQVSREVSKNPSSGAAPVMPEYTSRNKGLPSHDD
jgi:hypothetical protein